MPTVNTPLNEMLNTFTFCLLSRGDSLKTPLLRGEKLEWECGSITHDARGVFVGINT